MVFQIVANDAAFVAGPVIRNTNAAPGDNPVNINAAATGTDAVAWTRNRQTPYVPSPLLYGDALYFLKHYQGQLTSVRASAANLDNLDRLVVATEPEHQLTNERV